MVPPRPAVTMNYLVSAAWFSFTYCLFSVEGILELIWRRASLVPWLLSKPDGLWFRRWTDGSGQRLQTHIRG